MTLGCARPWKIPRRFLQSRRYRTEHFLKPTAVVTAVVAGHSRPLSARTNALRLRLRPNPTRTSATTTTTMTLTTTTTTTMTGNAVKGSTFPMCSYPLRLRRPCQSLLKLQPRSPLSTTALWRKNASPSLMTPQPRRLFSTA